MSFEAPVSDDSLNIPGLVIRCWTAACRVAVCYVYDYMHGSRLFRACADRLRGQGIRRLQCHYLCIWSGACSVLSSVRHVGIRNSESVPLGVVFRNPQAHCYGLWLGCFFGFVLAPPSEVGWPVDLEDLQIRLGKLSNCRTIALAGTDTKPVVRYNGMNRTKSPHLRVEALRASQPHSARKTIRSTEWYDVARGETW